MANPEGITREEALEFLARFVKSYNSGSEDYFNHFTDEATFFALSVPTRVDGLKEYRVGFERAFSRGKDRTTQILSPEVRLLGASAALITFYNRVQVDDLTSNNRLSLVVERTKGGLKVSHLHASAISAPTIRPEPGGREDIRILEERVATAIGAVGTPK